jgi:hypothetical protein
MRSSLGRLVIVGALLVGAGAFASGCYDTYGYGGYYGTTVGVYGGGPVSYGPYYRGYYARPYYMGGGPWYGYRGYRW